jgi:hypothetical protein
MLTPLAREDLAETLKLLAACRAERNTRLCVRGTQRWSGTSVGQGLADISQCALCACAYRYSAKERSQRGEECHLQRLAPAALKIFSIDR